MKLKAFQRPNKSPYLAIIATDNPRRMDLGGDAVDQDAIAVTKLKEEMRLRHRRYAAGPKSVTDAMTPKIKMIVSNWYTDEVGNRARVIQAREK
jgi:hypothetical protein